MSSLYLRVCACDYGKEETINHLFLECDFFQQYYAQQLFGALAFKKKIRLCFQVVYLVCIWIIWKERNSIILILIFTFGDLHRHSVQGRPQLCNCGSCFVSYL